MHGTFGWGVGHPVIFPKRRNLTANTSVHKSRHMRCGHPTTHPGAYPHASRMHAARNEHTCTHTHRGTQSSLVVLHACAPTAHRNHSNHALQTQPKSQGTASPKQAEHHGFKESPHRWPSLALRRYYAMTRMAAMALAGDIRFCQGPQVWSLRVAIGGGRAVGTAVVVIQMQSW